MRKKYVMILLSGMLVASTLMTACGGGNTATTAAATEAVTTAAAATTEAAAETEAETTAAAAEEKSALGEAIDLDKQDPPKHDFSRANRLPMTGYMTKSFEDGRSIKVYISKEAPIRPYFTIVAVPDGVDTAAFISESGWADIAEERGEGLFILEPAADGWKAASEEAAYLEEAMGFYNKNDFFSIFGENYLVGYEAGAAPLELWAAQNPLRVISQVYVNSDGLDAETLAEIGKKEYDGTNGNYAEIQFPEGFMKLTNNDIVVPTWYIQEDDSKIADSLSYWKAANDCEEQAASDGTYGDVYAQKEDSERWMTDFAGPISKVAVKKGTADTASRAVTDEIESFMNYYNRYENAVAYSNTLMVRLDEKASGIEYKNIEVNGQLREYSVYVPKNAEEKFPEGSPVVFVFPGNAQTDRVFMDATAWWEVADDEGIIIVTICEQYNDKATAVSHVDTLEFYRLLREQINKDYKVDATRFYASGQSAGSLSAQAFGYIHPEYFAAIASTSGCGAPEYAGLMLKAGKVKPEQLTGEAPEIPEEDNTASNARIPTYMITGGGDNVDFNGTLWDDNENYLDTWAAYHMEVEGFSLMDESDYVTSGKHDRHHTWTWNKTFDGEEVPLLKVGQNIYRSHNCMAEEMPMLWEYMSHFKTENDENGNAIARYYSASSFAEDDMVELK